VLAGTHAWTGSNLSQLLTFINPSGSLSAPLEADHFRKPLLKADPKAKTIHLTYFFFKKKKFPFSCIINKNSTLINHRPTQSIIYIPLLQVNRLQKIILHIVQNNIQNPLPEILFSRI